MSNMRPAKSPQAGDLPDSELDVVSFLWRNGSATSREIRDGLASQRPMTDGALASLLNRLERKGFIKRRKPATGQYIYTPSRDPKTGYRQLVRKLVDRVFGGDSPQLVLSLLEEIPATDEELKRIEKIIKQVRSLRQRSEP
jgi:BlaI family transcriptional regulator, penicillinase repressor